MRKRVVLARPQASARTRERRRRRAPRERRARDLARSEGGRPPPNPSKSQQREGPGAKRSIAYGTTSAKWKGRRDLEGRRVWVAHLTPPADRQSRNLVSNELQPRACTVRANG